MECSPCASWTAVHVERRALSWILEIRTFLGISAKASALERARARAGARGSAGVAILVAKGLVWWKLFLLG